MNANSAYLRLNPVTINILPRLVLDQAVRDFYLWELPKMLSILMGYKYSL